MPIIDFIDANIEKKIQIHIHYCEDTGTVNTRIKMFYCN